LTRLDAPLSSATAQGHRLAAAVVLAVLVCGGLGVAASLVERSVPVPQPIRRAYTGRANANAAYDAAKMTENAEYQGREGAMWGNP